MSPGTDPLDEPTSRIQRFQRFEHLFNALGRLADHINEILAAGAMKVGKEHAPLLSLIIALSFGKALKTFQLRDRVCVLGYGEDALVLVRTNINVLINTAFILSPNGDPTERALDFLAYSVNERIKFLKAAHNQDPSWPLPMPAAEVADRVKRWGTIANRAAALPPFHYTGGHKLYSSFEHSDLFALDAYFTDWDEIGPRIESGESDAHVGLALVHSYAVMADLFTIVLRFFGIDRPDLTREIRETWPTLNPDTVPKP
ncbi:MAG: DUF5677 domain-containing protein [Candidatus Rokuibacteriota bacterium]